jgi:hypothetical protein
MAFRFKAGDAVEVLDADSILCTLQSDGTLDGMPFMPEMLRHCGQRFKVGMVAHKSCDTQFKTGGRKLDDCYHLDDLRCDGAAHGGCEAACLIFWKGAWLRPATNSRVAEPHGRAKLTQEQLHATTATSESGKTRYLCQATRFFYASKPLKWWDLRQYAKDVSTGNRTLGHVLKITFLASLRTLTRIGIGYRLSVWFYDKCHRALMKRPAPWGNGIIPVGQPTPSMVLDLKPGEHVRVRSHDDIKKTLSEANRNRGLWFDHDYVPFCGTEQVVSRKVRRIIDERTGEMLEMKNPCIVLEGVNCRALYGDRRLMCPRAITAYWREAWLERVPPPG